MNENRPDWDQYFLDIAEKVATRSTCLRLKVGCVLVAEDNRILSTGYNGSPKGMPHCLDDGCLKNEQGRCIRTVHAEINAILSVDPAVRKNGTLYCTHEPCEHCTKSIIQAGIKKVIYKNPYPNAVNIYFSKYIEWICFK
jgi:dCMP deaminase